MVDFSTYRRLHFPKNGTMSVAEGPEYMTDEAMACDKPPEMPDIMVFPRTFTAYNLRTKKWCELLMLFLGAKLRLADQVC
jgi:hypothetical protein